MRLADVACASVRNHLNDLGIADLKFGELVRDIPYPVLRLIDLARALASDPIVLMLDEITAALPADLSEQVFAVVRRWRERGNSVIFISHRIAEVAALCDRATVLRDGVSVGVDGRRPRQRRPNRLAHAWRRAESQFRRGCARTDRAPRGRGAGGARSPRSLLRPYAQECLLQPSGGRDSRCRGARGSGAAGTVRLYRGGEPPRRRRDRGSRPKVEAATTPATRSRRASCWSRRIGFRPSCRSARSARTSPCRSFATRGIGASFAPQASASASPPPSSACKSTPAPAPNCAG